MKFELAKPKFQPVTITLESQEEVWDLVALLSKASMGEAYTNVYYQLYAALGGNETNAGSGLKATGNITISRKLSEF